MSTFFLHYNTSPRIVLGPHQSSNIGSGAVSFISEHEGQINSQLTYGYSANGKSEQTTKTFSFNVFPTPSNTNSGINPHAPPCFADLH